MAPRLRVAALAPLSQTRQRSARSRLRYRRGCPMAGAERLSRYRRGQFARVAGAGPCSVLALDLNGAVAPDPLSPKRFDLILSNFGALNCVDDIAVLAARLQGWSKPGGVVALNFMGRFCAWESAYYGLRANSAALRRLRGRARARVGGRDIHIRYWSIGEIR